MGSLVTTTGECIAETGQYTDLMDGNTAATGKDTASPDEYPIFKKKWRQRLTIGSVAAFFQWIKLRQKCWYI